MKRKSTYEKKQELKAFCRRQKCESCPLVTKAYCMLGDESPKAIDEAYAKTIEVKVKRRE